VAEPQPRWSLAHPPPAARDPRMPYSIWQVASRGCRCGAFMMVKVLHCWRCQMEMPMLEEHEATYVLKGGHDPDRILQRYRELTGFEETNANAIWHHVVGLQEK
jgi:hypothetical protein